MNSKEALIKLSNMASPYYWRTKEQLECINIVEQDLDRLEKLEEIKNIHREIRDIATEAVNENSKLKKAIEILKDKINSYLELLYSKEYFNEHIKGKYSTIGVANRNGQEKALRTILNIIDELLKEVFGNE